MDGLQGAVLRIKLRRLEEWTARRRELAALYSELLAGTNVELPEDDPADSCVYHVFAVYLDERDAVQSALAERGIATGIHYPVPIHLQAPYRWLGFERGAFPHAERACDRELSLPFFPEMSDEQVRHVAAVLTEVTGSLEARASQRQRV